VIGINLGSRDSITIARIYEKLTTAFSRLIRACLRNKTYRLSFYAEVDILAVFLSKPVGYSDFKYVIAIIFICYENIYFEPARPAVLSNLDRTFSHSAARPQ
jgi:hypothetical protein